MRVQTRIGMPMDEFIRQYDDAPFELINGEIIPKMPTVSGHNRIAKRVFVAFLPFEQQGLGEVFQEATYVLIERPDWVKGSRIPDVMWISADKLSQFRESIPDADNKPYIVVPDIVVEVVSPTDKPAAVKQGIDSYLSDGIRLVWVIYPDTREIDIYQQASEQPIRLSADAVLDAGEVLPGFILSLTDIFG